MFLNILEMITKANNVSVMFTELYCKHYHIELLLRNMNETVPVKVNTQATAANVKHATLHIQMVTVVRVEKAVFHPQQESLLKMGNQ